MKTIQLPYGREQLHLTVEDTKLTGVLTSGIGSYVPEADGDTLVEQALQAPIGSPSLRELAAGKQRVVIISSDHTRPVPSHILMPKLLREIRLGNPQAEIAILVATGLHRSPTAAELEGKYGAEITARERIVVHDCDDADNLVDLGRLPSGGRLQINRLAAEADLLVAEGFIEPHFFAGFSGGRKSVLPGVAGRETVLYNHNAGFIDHPRARTGVLEGNPIHEDMCFAARAAKLAFILNVVIDAAHDPIYAVAGDPFAAHGAGVAFLQTHCRVAPVPAKIVVTTNGGYPLDQNLYQAVKGMTAAEATVEQDGVIIMAAMASDGHGGKHFYEMFRDEPGEDRLLARFRATPPEQTAIDQWQAQIFARVLKKARVILISSCEDQLVRDLHMIPAHSVEEAMELAASLVGAEASVTVIPDGVAVMVTAE